MIVTFDLRYADFDFTCPRCGYEIHEGDPVAFVTRPVAWVLCLRCAQNYMTGLVPSR
jgi:hypothetical protein